MPREYVYLPTSNGNMTICRSSFWSVETSRQTSCECWGGRTKTTITFLYNTKLIFKGFLSFLANQRAFSKAFRRKMKSGFFEHSQSASLIAPTRYLYRPDTIDIRLQSYGYRWYIIFPTMHALEIALLHNRAGGLIFFAPVYLMGDLFWKLFFHTQIGDSLGRWKI